MNKLTFRALALCQSIIEISACVCALCDATWPG